MAEPPNIAHGNVLVQRAVIEELERQNAESLAEGERLGIDPDVLANVRVMQERTIAHVQARHRASWN